MCTSNLVSLRSAAADDEAFLLKLFESTRIDEFRFLDGDATQLQALIRMQFNLQRQQYEAGYPEAEHNIIMRDNQPIGRLLVDESERQFTLVDIALLPECRNAGIGQNLLDTLLARAAVARKPVRLHVMRANPAQHLYERLGFRRVSEDAMYFEMLWDAVPEIQA